MGGGNDGGRALTSGARVRGGQQHAAHVEDHGAAGAGGAARPPDLQQPAQAHAAACPSPRQPRDLCPCWRLSRGHTTSSRDQARSRPHYIRTHTPRPARARPRGVRGQRSPRRKRLIIAAAVPRPVPLGPGVSGPYERAARGDPAGAGRALGAARRLRLQRGRCVRPCAAASSLRGRRGEGSGGHWGGGGIVPSGAGGGGVGGCW